jgi:hypothetical protein
LLLTTFIVLVVGWWRETILGGSQWSVVSDTVGQ